MSENLNATLSEVSKVPGSLWQFVLDSSIINFEGCDKRLLNEGANEIVL